MAMLECLDATRREAARRRPRVPLSLLMVGALVASVLLPATASAARELIIKDPGIPKVRFMLSFEARTSELKQRLLAELAACGYTASVDPAVATNVDEVVARLKNASTWTHEGKRLLKLEWLSSFTPHDGCNLERIIEPVPTSPSISQQVQELEEKRCQILTDPKTGIAEPRWKTYKQLLLQVRIKDRAKLEPSKKDFTETARIDVDSSLTDTGINLKIQVTSNPDYMCLPTDLVPVTLERPGAGVDPPVIDTIAVLLPTLEQNSWTVSTFYTWAELAILLGWRGATKEQVVEEFPELGVRAQWLAKNSEGTFNGPNHTSGGLFQKGGSGKVRLREVSLEELQASETVRNTDWNAGEKLRSERPLYKNSGATFQSILRLAEEVATTLEAESEYMLGSLEQLDGIVNTLNQVVASEELRDDLGIVAADVKTPKIYTDTYYDIVGTPGGTQDHWLLKHDIVLRRRSVAGDPEGTFLLAVKGRTKVNGVERIRLASQVNLKAGEMIEDPAAMTKLKQFISDTSTDNPFGRVLADALQGQGKTLPSGTWHLAPVLVIESTRRKFSFELANSTAIDFSADVATGQVTGKPRQTVYSFEFGVGHPGLSASASATLPSSRPGRALIVRPYHVPADLDNAALFRKSDYGQYQKLRDALISRFGLDRSSLEIGGNKASRLAKSLGIIP